MNEQYDDEEDIDDMQEVLNLNKENNQTMQEKQKNVSFQNPSDILDLT